MMSGEREIRRLIASCATALIDVLELIDGDPAFAADVLEDEAGEADHQRPTDRNGPVRRLRRKGLPK